MAIEIADLTECPHCLDSVAESIWRAWWQDRAPLETVRGLVADNLAGPGIPLCLVARVDGDFAGTVSLIETDIDVPTDLRPWLAALWVEPDHRRKGVAGALIVRLVDAARALGESGLHLCAHEDLAAFYGRFGFAVTAPLGDGYFIFHRTL